MKTSMDSSLAFTALLELMPGFGELESREGSKIVAALVQDWSASTTPGMGFWDFAKSWVYRHPPKATTRDQLIFTAKAKGWDVQSYQSGDPLRLTRRGVLVLVEFSSRGGITYAGISGLAPMVGRSSDQRAEGKGKLAQVLTWLEG